MIVKPFLRKSTVWTGLHCKIIHSLCVYKEGKNARGLLEYVWIVWILRDTGEHSAASSQVSEQVALFWLWVANHCPQLWAVSDILGCLIIRHLSNSISVKGRNMRRKTSRSSYWITAISPIECSLLFSAFSWAIAVKNTMCCASVPFLSELPSD